MSSFKTLQNEQVSEEGSTTRKINNLLNSSKGRSEGLQLLSCFLPQCSDEDFLRFCISWMQNCCKIDGLTRNKDFVIQLLNDLFKTSSNYPELKKSISFFITTRYFDFFFKHFLHSQGGWSCTLTCMLLYRGACGPFQESLEKHLKTEIGRNAKISSNVAHCFALLPSVGGGGNEGICYKKNWRTWFAKFLSISHSLLQDLFTDVEEVQEYEKPEHVYEKRQNETSPAYLAIQIHNHCSVLSCMLLSEYPAPKNVPVDLIFQLICRGLAITPKLLEKHQIADILSVKKVLPQIHCSLLSLLKATIVTCKSHLLPYSHLVCKLITQTLEWTESELTSGRLRESAYEALCNWVAVTGSGSCVENISGVVISNAVEDVVAKKKVVFLKEAKRQNQFGSGEHRARRMNAGANARLCRSGLKALQFLLKFAGASLKPEEHKFLQELAVKLILQLQKSVSDVTVPFDVPSCRLELYGLLVELTLQPCPKWPPPTHFALRLLERGLNDACPRICSLCSTALSVMTIIIHPQYNNGGFPSESGSQREVELEWKMSAEGDHDKPCLTEENVADSRGGDMRQAPLESARCSGPGEMGSNERVNNLGDESDASSSGDSRTTVTFSKNASNSSNERLDEGEEAKGKCSLELSPSEGEPSPKIQKIASEARGSAGDQQPLERPSSLSLLENKLGESDQLEPSSSAKSLSPESATEEGHVKKRYFLRSKTKGSSEEPEEAIKRAISLDSLKTTPVRTSPRGSPNILASAKRPRTRALSKIETTGDAELTETTKRTADDDDEDILATFDDSLVE